MSPDHCPSHDSTITILQQIRADLKWHNQIGKAMFGAGLVLIGLAISALIYFGSLENRVTHLESEMDQLKDAFNSIHSVVID